MRKALIFIILATICLSASLSNAEDTVIKKEIYGTNYTISFSEDWLYGDKGVSDNSRILKELGMDAHSFITSLESDDTLFIALNKYLNSMLIKTSR